MSAERGAEVAAKDSESSAAASIVELSMDTLSVTERYRLMTDLVAPRPIAWVSTRSRAGIANLAPFSYYQAVCSDPPTVMLSISSQPDGRAKDTLRNLLDTGVCTISHVHGEQLEAMNQTAASLAAHQSEWTYAGIRGAPAQRVAPERVADSHGGFECRLTHAIPLGQRPDGAPSVTMLLLEVLCAWLRNDLLTLDARGKLAAIQPAALASLGRLGGTGYAVADRPVEVARPMSPKDRPIG